MGRIDDALRRASRGPAATQSPDARPDPDWLADPFDSPWQFEAQAESADRRVDVEQADDAPPPASRKAAAIPVHPRAPLPVETAPVRRQPVPPPAAPAPAPGILRPENSQGGSSASVRVESQLAMRWPQPFSGEVSEKLVLTRGTDPAAVEQYRQLAAAVREAQPAGSGGILVVTSAVPGEGKTLTAVNLALTLSEGSNERVLLVDADLRDGRIHRLFQVTGGAGLAERLQSDSAPPVTDLTARLALMQRGRAPLAAELLDSDRMRTLLADASRQYDRVIVDAPPASEAAPLARAAGKVLLVVDPATPQAKAAAAIEAVGSDRLLGVVRNRVR